METRIKPANEEVQQEPEQHQDANSPSKYHPKITNKRELKRKRTSETTQSDTPHEHKAIGSTEQEREPRQGREAKLDC